MKPWPFLWCLTLLAGCDKPSAAERGPGGKPAASTPEATAPPVAEAKSPAGAQQNEARFDLVRDTGRVRESVVGTWYQVDHSLDGSATTLGLVKYFGDGTARAEYWTLVNSERRATFGTDRGEWKMRGDTILLHFEGQQQPATETKPVPPPVASTPSVNPPPATPSDLPPAAAAPEPAPAAPASANTPEPPAPRDDEQRLLEAAADWFTYEYRPSGVAPTDVKPDQIMVGVSVRVGSEFRLPQSIPGYRTDGAAPEPAGEPESVTGKLLKHILR